MNKHDQIIDWLNDSKADVDYHKNIQDAIDTLEREEKIRDVLREYLLGHCTKHYCKLCKKTKALIDEIEKA